MGREQKYDAVVGDVTIRHNRSLYVDFTLPFTESGVSMIVPVTDGTKKNAWVFLKPLTLDMWLGSLAFVIYTGFVIWVMEHRINTDFRGPFSQQLGTIFFFSFSTLVFSHSCVRDFSALRVLNFSTSTSYSKMSLEFKEHSETSILLDNMNFSAS